MIKVPECSIKNYSRQFIYSILTFFKQTKVDRLDYISELLFNIKIPQHFERI